jgi:DNA-binding MurR/RpiR family transcriptional regulator
MPTFRDLITDAGLELTSSARKVTCALPAPYRRNGLGPTPRLAERAGVHDFNLVRRAKAHGFSGFANFQNALPGDRVHRLHAARPPLPSRTHLQQVHLRRPRLFTRPPRAIALGRVYFFLLIKTGPPTVLSESSNG